MTDKEKIIVDGIDISNCLFHEVDINRKNICELNYMSASGYNICYKCSDNPNCYFKQKARKEQECEKLKEENEETKAQRDTYISLMNVYKNISKGRQDSEIVINYIDKLKGKLKIAEQALDEIEKKCCAVLNGDEKILYAYQIKEIINKAKDTTNET